MIIIKTYLKYIGFYTLFLVLIIFLSSILNLYGINESITNIILFIFNLSSFVIFGFLNGKKATKNGYIAGLKISSIFLLELIILNIITTDNILRLSTIIYYIILLISGTMGGMLGINKKGDD